MSDAVVGFTGTRGGMSERQKLELRGFLEYRKFTTGVHGGCIGADAEFHEICRELGMKTVIYPGYSAKNPSDLRCRAELVADVVHGADTHFSRNRKIVEACDLLIGGPATDKRTRGGTWYTIEYARKTGKALVVLKR